MYFYGTTWYCHLIKKTNKKFNKKRTRGATRREGRGYWCAFVDVLVGFMSKKKTESLYQKKKEKMIDRTKEFLRLTSEVEVVPLPHVNNGKAGGGSNNNGPIIPST